MAPWTSKGKPVDAQPLGDLKPRTVLWEWEGPRLFTCVDAAGKLLLAHQCDEEGGLARFLVVPFSEELLKSVQTDELTIREALNHQRAWLATVARRWQVVEALAVKLLDIPSDMLPEPMVTLNHEEGPPQTLRPVGANLVAEVEKSNP